MIRFLKVWWGTFREFSLKNFPSNNIDPTERISRYILNRKGKFSRENQRVKYSAFLPPPNLEMSVYRIDDLGEHDIWEIGTKYVAEPQGKHVYARGDLRAKTIFSVGLGIAPDPKPHKLHANIINWPVEKDKQKMRAVELANAAVLQIPPIKI